MSLQLLHPAWLLLAPLPWLLAARRGRRAAYGAPDLQPRLRLPGPRRVLGPGLALAWLLALLAAARPVWLAPLPQTRLGVDLVVLLDLSPSMAARDLPPSRLERARLELAGLLERLAGRGDRLGLVAFAANAYPLLPPTADRALFRRTLAALDPAQAPHPGTHLGRALEVGRRLLAASPAGARALLLLSDGEAHDGRAAVEAALRELARERIPVLALGLGTPAGAPVPAVGGGPPGALPAALLEEPGTGRPVRSRLHRALLERVARATGGAYAEAAAGDPWPALLGRLRQATRPVPLPGTAGSLRELAPWPLALSLTLFLWALLPRGRASAALLALPPALLPALLPTAGAVLLAGLPAPARAGPLAAWLEAYREERAHRELSAGRAEGALAAYRRLPGWRARLGEGAAAYRLGRLEEALEAFRRAAAQAPGPRQRAVALLDAGNALARLERLEEAAAAWREALRLDPGLRAAALNLGALDRLRLGRRGGGQGGAGAGGEEARSPRGPGPGEAAALARRWRRTLAAGEGPLAPPGTAPGPGGDPAFALSWLMRQADDTRYVQLMETPPW